MLARPGPPPRSTTNKLAMWKRLTLLWSLIRGDARELWFALRHSAAPSWLTGIRAHCSVRALAHRPHT
jgi:hypothetical protein